MKRMKVNLIAIMTLTTLLINYFRSKTSMMLGNILRYKHNVWNEMAFVTKTKDREQSKRKLKLWLWWCCKTVPVS